ncbi:MAG: hypothetical protein P9M11_10750 [Candidatus Tenebribacter burtonii]|jgi:hypothetical protein|nr:hypothetical protein [Candidatus Tenebribacter burtonii]
MKNIIIFLFIFFSCFLFSQEVLLIISDKPNDDGSALLISWDTSQIVSSKITIDREIANGEFISITNSEELTGTFEDGSNINPGIKYEYRLTAFDNNGEIIQIYRTSGESSVQWFNKKKISLLIFAILITISIVYYIFSARSGKDLYIRKISGLESMDESVGRATEMGRPILFIPGTLDLDDMQTIAGLTILRRLAQKAAEYDAKLIVPVCRSMVLSTAKEIVKEAYMKAGRPDAYDPDSVFYLTDDQFGYVAGVDGIIVREKPAANFFLGAFYAESLILAETGFSSGAIQTAGTAMPSQLPFFVVACDYTLIGEELFAASAYLSKDPHQLGSLKGQDFGKAIFIVVLMIGIILEISGIHFLKDFLTLH